MVGVILIGVMVLSTAGYAFFNTGKDEVKSIEYKGVKFLLGSDGLWHFNVNGYSFSTSYNPKETENISVSSALKLGDYSGRPLYFLYDSKTEGTSEIIKNLGNLVSRVQYACLEECNENWPIKIVLIIL